MSEGKVIVWGYESLTLGADALPLDLALKAGSLLEK